MSERKQITAATIEAMADQFVGVELSADQKSGVAGLLNALAADMQAMRDMKLGNTEPAPIFEAIQR